ncbi:MAG: hypothetical protein K0S64_1502 [Gaiellaceae bacterium]|nr:hypothetical protein [Gaiellaceae bacterium]
MSRLTRRPTVPMLFRGTTCDTLTGTSGAAASSPRAAASRSPQSGLQPGNDTTFRGTPTAGPCGGGTEGSACLASDDTKHVFVYTSATNNVPNEDHAFYVAVIG